MRAIYAETLIAAADRTITLFSPTLLRPRPHAMTAIDRSHVGLRPRCMFHCVRLFSMVFFLKNTNLFSNLIV